MLDLPKPKAWDLAAIVAAGLGVALAVANAVLALGGQAGESPSTSFSLGMVFAQLVVLSISLLLLGKTAKEGTIWGNLAAVGGLLIGTSGILLAGAMWVAA